MRKVFENFDICYYEDDYERPFMIMCKDRTVNAPDGKWVSNSLSKDEAKELYEFLKKYFNN